MSNDKTKPDDSPLVLKLKKNRDEKSGDESITLKGCGVKVSYPLFRNHGMWSGAMRMAKNDINAAQVYYLCKVARFDGEKLTATDLTHLFRCKIPLICLARCLEKKMNWGSKWGPDGL